MNTDFHFQDHDLYAHHKLDTQPNPNEFVMHTHDYLEIFCFLNGDANYIVEGNHYPLQPGDILIMRTTEAHRAQINAVKPYERISLHFKPELLNRFDPEHHLLRPFYDRPLGMGNQYFAADFRDASYIDYLKKSVSCEKDSPIIKFTLITNLFGFLIELNDAFDRKPKADTYAPADNLILSLIDYINRHLFEDLSLHALCSTFFISQTQANKLFRAATGTSIWNYILIKRLHNARAGILDGKDIQTVCQECGFKDYSAFFRAYKKRFGCAPKQDKLARHSEHFV